MSDVFHPVIRFPEGETYDVFDFTKGYDKERTRAPYGVGKYDENRKGMYTTALFSPDDESARTIHIGIDLSAPEGSEVYAFADGEIFLTGINSASGDYGGTVITKHSLDGRPIWALHGHLSHASVTRRGPGDKIRAGDVIGWLGSESENGGWNPHVHFQLSWKQPEVCDMPGVVSLKDRAAALRDYPDPRIVLGPLY